MTTDLIKGGNVFALKMMNSIDEESILKLIKDAELDIADPVTLFRGGYLQGALDGFITLSPRAMDMGRLLKILYIMLGEMTARHDDLTVLNDLTALHCQIAGYLVSESESILASSRAELSKKSGVPDLYLDNVVTMSEIPHATLVEIGRTAASADHRRFAIYSVSGGIASKTGEPLTFEELVEMVKEHKIEAKMPDTGEVQTLLSQYGAMQVRAVRKAFTKIVDSLDVYKKAHEADAKMVADSVISKMKA